MILEGDDPPVGGESVPAREDEAVAQHLCVRLDSPVLPSLFVRTLKPRSARPDLIKMIFELFSYRDRSIVYTTISMSHWLSR